MRRKTIFLISAVILTLVAISGGAVLLAHRLLSNPLFAFNSPPMPPALEKPRIVTGASFLTHSEFFRTKTSLIDEALGRGIEDIDDIAVGELDPHPGIDIVIAGRDGAIVLDNNGIQQSEIRYKFQIGRQKRRFFESTQTYSSLGDIQIVDLKGDGTCEYLARGGVDGAAIFDHQGNLLWSYGRYTKEKTSIDDMTVGDLNGDGVSEFVVSWKGLEAFDMYGNRIWERPARFGPSQIEVVDTDNDGKKKIVSIGSELTIRDADGKEIKTIDTPAGYVGKFSLCTPPNKKVPNILAVNNGRLWLLDFNGQAVANFDAPLSDFPDVVQTTPFGASGTSVYNAKGAWIKLMEAQPEYLAVIAHFVFLNRSILYVYEPSGKIVYQEILPEEGTSIAVLPAGRKDGAQELLVGGAKTVWRYKAL